MSIDVLLQQLAKPAQRAIQNAGITTLEQLATFREEEISALHGIGKNALKTIKAVMDEHGLSFKGN